MDKVREIAERRKYFESALASSRMEGHEFTKAELDLIERVIKGELTEEQAMDYFRFFISELKELKPELFSKEG
ncbi:MAG: antitoxin VbhA family protein [Firmicutes bacterium]|nr:antitoxin VbhA family protein [Bacillota bacterium]